MSIIHDPIEQETSEAKDEKAIKLTFTGRESNQKISSMFAEAGFQTDFLLMDIPLKDASENFTFKHFQPGIHHALANDHALVIGIDEENNKIGIAVRKSPDGLFQLLNVHQLAALLVHIWQKEYPEDELTFVKSIHISEMIEFMAAKGRSVYKNIILEPGSIAKEITDFSRKNEKVHILGFTENQEFFDNTEDFVAIIEKIIRFEEQLHKEDKTLFDEINKLYQEYGFYKEKSFVVGFTGQSQRKHVQHMMSECKKNSPSIQERLSINSVIDFKNSKAKNFQTNKVTLLDYPSVNMLQIKFADGSSVTIAPQEEQVYYHISMKGSLAGKEAYQEINKEFDDRIFKLITVLNKF